MPEISSSRFLAYPLCHDYTAVYAYLLLTWLPLCRGNYWRPSMWISKQQIHYRSYILHSSNTWGKTGIKGSSESVFIHFKKTYDFIRREVFHVYNILIENSIPMKMVIKMCLNKTYSNVQVGKHLSNIFPSRKGLKQGCALSPLLFYFGL